MIKLLFQIRFDKNYIFKKKEKKHKSNNHLVYVYTQLNICIHIHIYFLCKTLGISGRAFSDLIYLTKKKKNTHF